MRKKQRILSFALATAMALPLGAQLAVSVSADSGWSDEQKALAYYTGALNTSQYDDGNPWTIRNRVVVLKEDDVKHEPGQDRWVDPSEADYDPALDPWYAFYGPTGYYEVGLNGDHSQPATPENDLAKPGVKLYLTLNPFWVYDGRHFADKEDLTGGTAGTGYTKEGVSIFDLDNDLSVKVEKGKNAKYVKSIKVVDKEFLSDELTFFTDQSRFGLPGYGDVSSLSNVHDRTYYAEVELKDSVVDNEYPVSFKITIKAKKDIDLTGAWGNAYFGLKEDDAATNAYWQPELVTDLVPGVTKIPAGTKITLESDQLWINNKLLEGDQDLSAGDHGLMIRPTKNEDNEMVWENGDGTIAKATFLGDSDTQKFYAKLSTKWDDAFYDEQFGDTNAFVYDFTGSPALSGVSRVTMALRNPFLDSDGEEIIPLENIHIYLRQEDGTVENVTTDFTYEEDDGGDPMFITKNRIFGTYIFSADPAAVELAEAEANKPVRFATGVMLPAGV